jgi:hypothetical protein
VETVWISYILQDSELPAAWRAKLAQASGFTVRLHIEQKEA